MLTTFQANTPHPAVPDRTNAVVVDGANPHSHTLKAFPEEWRLLQ